MKLNFQNLIYSGFLIFLFFIPASASAGTSRTFSIDPAYNTDSNIQQYQISATLKKSFDRLDFYVKDDFLESKDWTQTNEINNIFINLNSDFESKTYPQLTDAFGTDKYSKKEGVARIAVLFYPMKKEARGYTRNIDAYDKTVNPMSNQGETIYLNSEYIDSPLLPEILAHEFTHLIEFNQKNIQRSVAEDTWLSEARAEYAVTMLGYNDKAGETYLDKRIKDFLNKPSDSLIDWSGSSADYGVDSLFVHYLVEQYGLSVLTDSIKLNSVGVDSINEVLKNSGSKEAFSDIYANWAIAVYLNDCSVSPKYCYKNSKLKDVKVLPVNTYMPFFQESSVSANQLINDWSTNWQKFVGGVGDFKLDIKSPKDCNFKVSYIVKDLSDKSSVNILNFKDGEEKQIAIPNVRNVSSIVFIFSVEGDDTKMASNSFFVYNITASTILKSTPTEEIKLPFEVGKPLGQMTRDELLMVILRLIVYLLSQGKILTQ